MDTALCLEAEVKKETVVAVFFDVEKAYDMEGGVVNQA